jgi:hypothetical protein
LLVILAVMEIPIIQNARGGRDSRPMPYDRDQSIHAGKTEFAYSCCSVQTGNDSDRCTWDVFV